MDMLEKIKHAAAFIDGRTSGFRPEVGIILGTGLGGLVDHIAIRHAIEYADIPDFPVSTVEGHKGRLIFGELGGRRIVAMQGRFHYYEGYTPQQVVFPVRVMKLGDLMVINDHINLIPNPLIGPNIEELGPRFPDMKGAYDPSLIALATEIAGKEGIKLQYGCYVGLTGPTFETPQEYHYVRAIGGDAVGMSTTPEIIAARHMGIPCFGVSIITDLASDDSVSHEVVQEQGRRAEKEMTRLFIGMLAEL